MNVTFYLPGSVSATAEANDTFCKIMLNGRKFLFLRPLPATSHLKERSQWVISLQEWRYAQVNIAKKFAGISEYWKPYIAAELNGQHVKLDKLKASSSSITMSMKTKCFSSSRALFYYFYRHE